MLFVAIPCSSLALAVPSDGLSRLVLSMYGLSLKGLEKQRGRQGGFWGTSASSLVTRGMRPRFPEPQFPYLQFAGVLNEMVARKCSTGCLAHPAGPEETETVTVFPLPRLSIV